MKARASSLHVNLTNMLNFVYKFSTKRLIIQGICFLISIVILRNAIKVCGHQVKNIFSFLPPSGTFRVPPLFGKKYLMR